MGIFDGFTGGKQRDDMAAGHTAYRKALGAGTAAAKDYRTQGYGNAMKRLQPWSEYGQSGQQDYDLYRDAIGVNGADAQQSAYDSYSANPFHEDTVRMMQLQTQAGDRANNARGLFSSGTNALARARVADENAWRNQQDWLNRLQGSGQYGMQLGYGADNTMAGLDQSHYNQLAQDQLALSDAEAQSHLGLAGFDASTRGLGLNNLLKIAGTGTNALAAGYKAGMFK